MRLEALRVRNLDPAEHDMVALLEAVHIEARSATHVGQTGAASVRDHIRHRQISGCRDLHVFGCILDQRHGEAGPLRDGGIVREIRPHRFGRGAMGFANSPVMERLRRLRAP